MSCWTLVESTVYKVNWLNLGEPKVQVQLAWSQIYHFMTDTTYSSSGRRRMIHEPSSHSCIFGPLTTRHLWLTVHIFHLPPFFCLFFLRVVVVILVHARWIHSLKNKRGQNVCVRVVNLAPRLTNPFFFLPCDPRRQFERFCYSISYESPTLPQCSRTETEPGHQWVHAEWEWASVGLVRGNVIKFS